MVRKFLFYSYFFENMEFVWKVKSFFLNKTHNLFWIFKKKELVDILSNKYWEEVANLYEEQILQSYSTGNVFTKKRISKKIIDLLEQNPNAQDIKKIILDETPFELEKLPSWYELRHRNEEEMFDYIQLDVKWITQNWNHDILYDGVKHWRVMFVDDERNKSYNIINPYKDNNDLCISVIKWWKIVANTVLREHYRIESCIKNWYIAVQLEYQNQWFSKHLLYGSLKRASGQWYEFYHIWGFKPKWAWYILHNFKKLSYLFPEITFIKGTRPEIRNIKTEEKITI